MSKLLPLFDANAFLGRPVVRQPSAYTQVRGLKEVMLSLGIERALVYHSAAVRGDVMAGNRRLLQEIGEESSIVPCWVVLPSSTHEIPAPEVLVAEMLACGVRTVRCFPRTHSYQVRWRVLGELLEVLARHRIPLFLDFGVIHWSDPFFDWDGIAEICGACPDLPVVLVRVGLMLDRDLYPMLAQYPNLYIETSYYFVHQGLRTLAARFGAERMLWGTGMPAFAPGPAIALLSYSGLSRREQRLIGGENLERLLRKVRS